MPILSNTDMRRRAVLLAILDNCLDEQEAQKIQADFDAEEAIRTAWLQHNAAEVSAMVQALCPSNVPGAGDPDGFFRVRNPNGFNFLKPRVTRKPGDEDDLIREHLVYSEADEKDGWLGSDDSKQTIKFVRNSDDDEEVEVSEEAELGGNMDQEFEPEDQDEDDDIKDFYPMPGHPANAVIVPGRIKNTRIKTLMESIAGLQSRFWKSITSVSLVINKSREASVSLTTTGGANLVFSVEDFGRMFSVPTCNGGVSRIVFPELRRGNKSELYAWITVFASFTIGGNFIGGEDGPDFRIKSA